MEKFLIHHWEAILSSSFGFIQSFETTPMHNLLRVTVIKMNLISILTSQICLLCTIFLSYYVSPQQVNFLFLILGSGFKPMRTGGQITKTGNNYTAQITAAKYQRVCAGNCGRLFDANICQWLRLHDDGVIRQ